MVLEATLLFEMALFVVALFLYAAIRVSGASGRNEVVLVGWGRVVVEVMGAGRQCVWCRSPRCLGSVGVTRGVFLEVTLELFGKGVLG